MIPHGVGVHHIRFKYLMMSKLDFIKIAYPNMGYSNTVGFRVTMSLWLKEVYLKPQPENPMWSPMLTLNQVVLEDICMGSQFLVMHKVLL